MAASPNVRSAVGDLDMLFLKPDGIGFVFDAADGMPTRVCSIDLARMFGDGMSDAARQLCHLISRCGVRPVLDGCCNFLAIGSTVPV